MYHRNFTASSALSACTFDTSELNCYFPDCLLTYWHKRQRRRCGVYEGCAGGLLTPELPALVEQVACFNTMLSVGCPPDALIVFESARFGRNDTQLAGHHHHIRLLTCVCNRVLSCTGQFCRPISQYIVYY